MSNVLDRGGICVLNESKGIDDLITFTSRFSHFSYIKSDSGNISFLNMAAVISARPKSRN